MQCPRCGKPITINGSVSMPIQLEMDDRDIVLKFTFSVQKGEAFDYHWAGMQHLFARCPNCGIFPDVKYEWVDKDDFTYRHTYQRMRVTHLMYNSEWIDVRAPRVTGWPCRHSNHGEYCHHAGCMERKDEKDN